MSEIPLGERVASLEAKVAVNMQKLNEYGLDITKMKESLTRLETKYESHTKGNPNNSRSERIVQLGQTSGIATLIVLLIELVQGL